MNVLLIDDNKKINAIVKEFLELKNYNVTSKTSGLEALELLNIKSFDLYVIDIHLPKINGVEIVKKIRNKNLNVPIIMITASTEVENFIEAFKNGCNEYIKKPFHLEELEIRINKLLDKNVTEMVKIDENISFDLINQELFINKEIFNLRKKENRLLTLLLKNRGQTINSKIIETYVWENKKKENYPLRQLVSGLKQKLPMIKNKIKAITNVGYRFE